MKAIWGGAIQRAWAHLGPRQRKLLIGIVIVLAGSLTFFMSNASDRAAVARGLRDPLSVFAARSPGARADGALYQTKRRLASATRTRPAPAGIAPHERVLAQERSRPAAPVGRPVLADAGPDARLLGLPENLIDLPRVDRPGFGPGFDVPPFAFGEGPTTAGTPDNPPSGPPSGPPSAVPETATWLMMVAGLGLAGSALRRRPLSRPAIRIN